MDRFGPLCRRRMAVPGQRVGSPHVGGRGSVGGVDCDSGDLDQIVELSSVAGSGCSRLRLSDLGWCPSGR